MAVEDGAQRSGTMRAVVRCGSGESDANTAAEEVGGSVEVVGLGGAVVRSAMMQAVGPQRLSWRGRPNRRGTVQARCSGDAQILCEV
jgi:hypothetical protein